LLDQLIPVITAEHVPLHYVLDLKRVEIESVSFDSYFWSKLDLT